MIRLVKTENPIACGTVTWKLRCITCSPELCECIRCNKSKHPIQNPSIITDTLQAFRQIISSEGCDRTYLPSRGSVFRSRCSLLKVSRPERLTARVPVDPGVSPSSCVFILFPAVEAKLSIEWPVLPHFRFLLCMQSLFPFRKGPTPLRCSVPHFPQPAGNVDCSFHDLQP
jgi:hypothetical protein